MMAMRWNPGYAAAVLDGRVGNKITAKRKKAEIQRVGEAIAQ